MELNLSIKDKFYDKKGSTFSVSKPDIYDDYRRTMDAEMFEKLVHDIILTKYSDCSETNEFILSLPKREQRLAIMSLIDGETKGDNNLLWSEMKAYVDSRPDKMEHLKDVIRIINKFVKDGSVEKKTYGEVLTPISLVNEMLETLPKEVWSNPDLKWLDPANGSGNFPFVVMYKLMKGLSEWEPDPEKRYKHIVENMIYVCELQSRNVFLWLCGIDPFDEYTTNTYWGSFLDEGFDKHMKEVWGLDKFQIVLGNPPYQSSSDDIRGSKSIYNIFVEKSKNISDKVLMVTPSRWFSNENMKKFRSFMLKSGLRLIKECDNNIFNDVDIKGGVSYFLLDVDYKGDVIFNGEYMKFDSGIISNDIINDIIKYVSDYDKLSNLFNSGSYFNIETNDKRLSNKGDIICHVSKKNGTIKYLNLSDLNGKQNIHKYKLLITSASGTNNNIGELGRMVISKPNEVCSSSFIHFTLDNEEQCKNLESYLNTKFIKSLIKIKKPTHRVKKDIFALVPLVDFNIKWNDFIVKKHFNISDDDYILIDNYLKNNI